MIVSPSATSAASTSEAEARRSEARTAAALSGVPPRTMARRPSILMFAPMRTSSCACMKRLISHDADRVGFHHSLHAGFRELLQDGGEVRGIASGDIEIPAGESSGEDEGSGFDAVGDDAMPCAMELSDALYANRGCAGALDLGAHRIEQRGEIRDFRFAGAVLHDGFAIGKRGGHQQIFSAGDGYFVEDDFGAFEPIAIDRISGGFDVAVFLRDLGTEALETFDMQINR